MGTMIRHRGTDQGGYEKAAMMIGDRIDDVKQRLSTVNEKTMQAVKQRPGAWIAGALAAGFVIGRILRR